ncbi:peptidoglycan-binding protein LysM [Geotalea uraniireducens]|uniref:Peptidoglycan-binding protein LysM n=1 Tax=Geotalea uraniireducens TaxID=351604 RepID=A0ABM8ENT8_9BACT|nr:LysM domain-containing protein [Geotalea uraniireducens]BDV44119.1 peptidoglycan-binding protein LysM [Geotalea uraniireducens]
MISVPSRFYAGIALAALILVCRQPRAGFALDPRFELDPRALDASPQQSLREKAGHAVRKAGHRSGEDSEYRVKAGDHIFKILMRDYGLSNREAEALIPEVKRRNGITDIRRLRVGQLLLIPLGQTRSTGNEEHAAKRQPAAQAPVPAVAAGRREDAAHALQMVKVAAERQQPDGVETARRVWDDLVPPTHSSFQPIAIEDKNFSLSLDPANFPTFAAADGGRILVDAGGKLPPLVRSLIEAKDPSLRIVAENPRNRKRFIASLLAGGHFYSVEENVSLEFGTDPKLTVNADFKVEKTADSLLRHDVVLLNVGDNRRAMPTALAQFLHQEGFQLLEPFPAREGESRPAVDETVHQITAREPRPLADEILRALSLPFETDRNVELYGVDDGGVRLFVRADRYFESGGDRYVVSYFDGDPVSYTLTRLLETRGYRVIMLDPQDDFQKVSGKILSRLRIPGSYASYQLLANRHLPYDIRLSGFKVHGLAGRSGELFLTNATIDPLFRDLLDYGGYRVVTY